MSTFIFIGLLYLAFASAVSLIFYITILSSALKIAVDKNPQCFFADKRLLYFSSTFIVSLLYAPIVAYAIITTPNTNILTLKIAEVLEEQK